MFQLEDVIESKFPALRAQPDIIVRPMLVFLKKLLREGEVNAFLAWCGDAEGFEFIDKVLEYFNFSYSAVGAEIEPERLATPRNPFEIPEDARAEIARLLPGEDYGADFRVLKQCLARMGVPVPTLYKQYADLCDVGGTRFLGFNVDPSFANCVDGLVHVDLLRLKPGKRARYLGDASRVAETPPGLLKTA